MKGGEAGEEALEKAAPQATRWEEADKETDAREAVRVRGLRGAGPPGRQHSIPKAGKNCRD